MRPYLEQASSSSSRSWPGAVPGSRSSRGWRWRADGLDRRRLRGDRRGGRRAPSGRRHGRGLRRAIVRLFEDPTSVGRSGTPGGSSSSTSTRGSEPARDSGRSTSGSSARGGSASSVGRTWRPRTGKRRSTRRSALRMSSTSPAVKTRSSAETPANTRTASTSEATQPIIPLTAYAAAPAAAAAAAPSAVRRAEPPSKTLPPDQPEAGGHDDDLGQQEADRRPDCAVAVAVLRHAGSGRG